MEKSIHNVPGKKADVADVARKLSEYVEAEAISRDNLYDKKTTVMNGGEIMVNQCQANSDYRGKELIEEIEAHKEHGAVIPIEAAMSQHQSFADGGTEERNPEQQGVFIHRKRSIAEADLGGVGTERLKKSLKPEGVDEVSANSAGNEGPNDCHTQRPETAPEDINLETSVCKEGESTTVPRVPRYKKRKIALFVAYCGVGYQGMQRNPGAVTIEGDLEEALFKAGAIAESNFGDPWKVEWMRAARTDKGVSAVGQVVSGRFFIDPAGFVERVNSHLPRQIHVLGYKRVTNTFNAKNLCDRRRYEYVLPVFTFDPSAHLDRESVKQLGGGIKVSICSETRQGSEGTVINEDFKNAAQDITELSQNIPDDVLQRESVREHSEEEPQLENGMEAVDRTLPKRYPKNHTQATDVSNVILRGTVPFDPSMGENEVQQEVHSSSQHNDGEKFGSLGVSSEPVILSKEASVKANFQFGEKHLSHFNSILSHYVGTHNFHNFTSRMKAEDPSAKRYIVSFEACSVFTIGCMEFVKCKVVGQSFMLHQIRKMIGLAVAIARGCAPLSIIETALRRYYLDI
ncbi:hypothetical protein O6H91_13G083800 [Diphasiastrum complanatum]|uniref:Uncharacterized protein n=1 Tax=Diphasiastrum complanatum TaxID=34168 RepID=A0ACC2BWN1_DIPCM|nr:hypothetical protein O6H91_13G083800 [Diphasiastrum complanatum]